MHVIPEFMGTWIVWNWSHTLSDYLDQAWGKPILIILSRRSYLLSPEPHCAFRHHPHYCLHLLTGCHLRDSHSLLLEDSASSRRGLMSSSELEHDARAEDWSLCMTFMSALMVFFVYRYGLYGTTILSPSRNYRKSKDKVRMGLILQ